MKECITSKEEIINECQKIMVKKGIESLNMRMIANSCKIALGTLYHYFPTKDVLLLTLIESIWQSILLKEEKKEQIDSFLSYLSKWFECLKKGNEKYPNFLTTHAILIEKNRIDDAKGMMNRYFMDIKEKLLFALKKDRFIKKEIFSDDLKEESFIDFVFENLMMTNLHKKDNMDSFLIIIQKMLY